MDIGEAICRAALTLVGTPFRAHGRCAETGVDCVGLALLSVRAAGVTIPDPPAYRLRAAAAPMVPGWMQDAGFVAGAGRQTGDVVIVRVSPLQPHVLIDAGGDMVHAYAGLGRVVHMPLPPEWPILTRWRIGPDVTFSSL